MKKVFLVLVILLVACTAVEEPQVQPSASALNEPFEKASNAAASEPAEIVAATEHFVFHSNFRLSLHDYLDWVVDEGDQQPADEADCFAALTGSKKEGWEGALSAYREDFGKRDDLRNGAWWRYATGWLDSTRVSSASAFENRWRSSSSFSMAPLPVIGDASGRFKTREAASGSPKPFRW
ncbi:MAG: hypothetical protein OES47_08780 [Acidobacteriota bacterium]|nr:hypothetical protein [Acidobacteriota bacterium]